MSPQAGQLLLNEIAPRLYRTVPQRVAMLGSEDAQELCQDALAMAASMLERVENQRKKSHSRKHCILHGPIAQIGSAQHRFK